MIEKHVRLSAKIVSGFKIMYGPYAPAPERGGGSRKTKMAMYDVDIWSGK